MIQDIGTHRLINHFEEKTPSESSLMLVFKDDMILGGWENRFEDVAFPRMKEFKEA